ncbi:MAG: hypothetical protein AAB432_02195 [Patescibacteria group bacterium]
MNEALEVTFRPKSADQKKECFYCLREATLEAVCAKEGHVAAIRCCDSDSCKEKAKKRALESIESIIP